MAQRVEVTLVDDLDGSTAAETIHFGLGGTQYAIDLSAAHAEQLRGTLAKYIEAARKGNANGAASSKSARKAATGAPNPSEVREWAKAEGYEVSERGRVSNDLVVKFQEAHN
jgi:hypothetical protein